MTFFKWSPDLALGLKEIDLQHKSLIQAVDALHGAFTDRGDARDLPWILQFLANYTVTHFQAEEEIMDATDYPTREGHEAQHRDLLQQVGAFLTSYSEGKADISAELLEFLKDWLVVHIGREDRALARHVRETCEVRDTREALLVR